MRYRLRLVARPLPVLYVATVAGANLAVERWGFVPVAPGLEAPAAVLFAGVALVLRDAVQEAHGWGASVVCVVLGAVVSAIVAPRVALASFLAFLVSELLDSLVWSKLRRRGVIKALLGSGVIGALVDSLIFLSLAFGSIDALAGSTIGKLYATAAAALLVVAARRGW